MSKEIQNLNDELAKIEKKYKQDLAKLKKNKEKKKNAILIKLGQEVAKNELEKKVNEATEKILKKKA